MREKRKHIVAGDIMKALQTVLIFLLVSFGIAFFIVIFTRFNENTTLCFAPSKKKLKCVFEILSQNISTEEHWNRIWPMFYKNGVIGYTKIDSVLSYIISNDSYRIVREQAISLLRERIVISVFGDDEIAEAIETFRIEVDLCNNQEVKKAGNALIRKVQRFCQRNLNNKKYDLIIQWIFNAIEIVGLILAIISF